MNLNKEKKFFSANMISQHLKELDVSPTLRINQQCRERISKGEKVYRLGLGQSPFPVPHSIVNALRLYAPQKDYLHVQGLPALRQTVADFHRKKDGLYFQPEHIIIGPGSKELLFLLQIVFDAVTIIPSPSWVSYLPQAKILKKEIFIINTKQEDDWLLMPQQLDSFCAQHTSSKPFLLILNYPGNPTGTTYTTEQLQQLAFVAEKHKIVVLSDEIYGELHHEGKHASIAKFYPQGTIVSSGLSKWCGAGGWRLGTFSFPPQLDEIMKAMAIVASETYTSVSAPIQYAAVTAFQCGIEIEEYLWHVRRILKSISSHLISIFQASGISVKQVQGAFYLFLDFESFRNVLAHAGIYTSIALCDFLLEKCNVAVLPGVDFNRPVDELTVRFSYVDFDGERALAASYNTTLKEPLPDNYLNLYCTNVVDAAKIIVDCLAKFDR